MTVLPKIRSYCILLLLLCLIPAQSVQAHPILGFVAPFFQEKPAEEETDPKKKKKKRDKESGGEEAKEGKDDKDSAKDLVAAEAKRRREAARAEAKKRREAARERRKQQTKRKRDEEKAAKEAAEAAQAAREADRQQRKQEWAGNKAQLERLEEAEARERERRREERKRLREAGLEPDPLFSSPIVRVKPFAPPPLEDRIYEKGEIAMFLPHGDEDEDGVVNQYDLCPLIPGLELYSGCPKGDPRGVPQSARYPELVQFDAFDRIYFEAQEDYLDGRARLVLNQAYLLLKKNPDVSLRLVGHADRAEGERTWDLSAMRVEAAKDYLRTKGVPSARLDTDIYGGMFPMNRGENEEERRMNRRVALVLFNPADEAATEETTTAEGDKP